MKRFLARAGTVGRKALALLGTYLDDLLAVSGGVCVVRGVAALVGRGWATVACGVLLMAYAVVVARSRRGGGG